MMQLQFKVEIKIYLDRVLMPNSWLWKLCNYKWFLKEFQWTTPNASHKIFLIRYFRTWSYCDKHLYKKILWYWTNLYWIKHLMGCIQCPIEIFVQCPKPSTFTFTFTEQKHLYSQCDYKWKSFTLPHLLHVGQGECKF
jgi:hypothetical protein